MILIYMAMIGHLCKVLKKLRQVNLKLNPTKCLVETQQISFLGHVVMIGKRPQTWKKIMWTSIYYPPFKTTKDQTFTSSTTFLKFLQIEK